jgi:cytochrome P450
MANMIRLFDQNPDQLELVRNDMSLVPTVIEETMRYEAPAQGLFRVTTRDVEMGEVCIPEGSIVQLMYASANRDERHFDEPDAYRVTRANARDQLGFGHGPHLCVGAELARLEMRVATEVFLSRVRDFQVVGEVPLYRHVIVRGPENLPISLTLA